MASEIFSILIHMVATIVSNTISTLGIVFRDLILILAIGFSTPATSIITLIVMSFMIALILIGIFKFGISSLKVIIIGIVVLFLLLFIGLMV